MQKRKLWMLVPFEFQINNDFFFSLKNVPNIAQNIPYTKNLKFKLKWAFCVLSGNPVLMVT